MYNRTLIIGAPNVGKSSYISELIGEHTSVEIPLQRASTLSLHSLKQDNWCHVTKTGQYWELTEIKPEILPKTIIIVYDHTEKSRQYARQLYSIVRAYFNESEITMLRNKMDLGGENVHPDEWFTKCNVKHMTRKCAYDYSQKNQLLHNQLQKTNKFSVYC